MEAKKRRNRMNPIQVNEQMIHGKKLVFYGDPASVNLFFQPVDEHDAELMGSEAEHLKELSGQDDWCIVTIPIVNWNQELTPWTNDPVFGKEGFGDGAPETLAFILESVIPALKEAYPSKKRRYYLAGYSLAGLFALWSAYQTDVFRGIAAVSPSVWYPGWIEFMKERTIRVSDVYLSLGDKEEKARNRVMASVGDAIRSQYDTLAEAGVNTVLEWNPGNHFMDSEIRTAKGLAWLLKNQ